MLKTYEYHSSIDDTVIAKGLCHFENQEQAEEYAFQLACLEYAEKASDGKYPTIFDFYKQGYTPSEAIDKYYEEQLNHIKFNVKLLSL
ncbi:MULTISPECIES: hypothetical protein [Bacillus cereus group]|uniref:Uncharacterized protein n=2 Tax=Bacillus thuringiensis TaxID=1428 RepID=A0A9X7FXV8_BACTU|nr:MULTISPECIES: hypothetical protein [Bacillus cereus group]PFT50816.1 hypothetical protein COK72_02075 [Bacillus thuringiensis]PFY22853.1 hypothetical protein COL44_18395 [Bacillus toyonensis]